MAAFDDMKKKITGFLGILIFSGIGYYIYSINSQIEGIKSICSIYKVGEQASDLEKNADKFKIQYMGAIDAIENPGTKSAIFCAPLTMCEVSCMIEFKNNIVTKNYSYDPR